MKLKISYKKKEIQLSPVIRLRDNLTRPIIQLLFFDKNNYHTSNISKNISNQANLIC